MLKSKTTIESVLEYLNPYEEENVPLVKKKKNLQKSEIVYIEVIQII